MKKLFLVTFIFFGALMLNANNDEVTSSKGSQRGGYIVCDNGSIHMAYWNDDDALTDVKNTLCNL